MTNDNDDDHLLYWGNKKYPQFNNKIGTGHLTGWAGSWLMKSQLSPTPL